MYLPVNAPLFATQQFYFQKLLALLKDNNVPVIVIDMPLTKENLALLPADTLAKYRDAVQSSCKKFSDHLLRPDFPMSRADFEDSAHMNAGGGKKLFKCIAVYAGDLVSSDKQLAGALNQVH